MSEYAQRWKDAIARLRFKKDRLSTVDRTRTVELSDGDLLMLVASLTCRLYHLGRYADGYDARSPEKVARLEEIRERLVRVLESEED